MNGSERSNQPTAPQRDQPRGGIGLLIIDMLNDFDFEGGPTLRAQSIEPAKAILRLREQADRLDLPTIYVNDNFGEWHSERSALIERIGDNLIHADIAPRDQDYFILKPQLSGFYATNLPVLLPKLGVSRLVLTGIAADICVLFTAADAKMRDYDLWIPGDCVAAETDRRRDSALAIANSALSTEVRPSSDLAFTEWLQRDD